MKSYRKNRNQEKDIQKMLLQQTNNSITQFRHTQSPSQHSQQYQKNIRPLSLQEINKYKSRLKKAGFHETNSFAPKLLKVVSQHCESSIKIEAHIGNYRASLYVCDMHAPLPKLQRECIGDGEFSQVVAAYKKGIKYASKILKVHKKNIPIVPNQVIQQIFMTKFAGALGIGPKFQPIYGFDMVVYTNKIEFSMENCLVKKAEIQQNLLLCQNKQYPQLKQININEKIRQDCFQNMAVLHQFKIIHKDIKPENLGWSIEKQKFVFLDFGFSCFVEEKTTQSTLTNFVGTFSYVCDQMKKIFFLKTARYINLYYNDFHCLTTTLQSPFIVEEFQYSLKAFRQEKIQKKTEQWQQFYIIKQFEFCLFTGQLEKAQSLISISKMRNILLIYKNKYEKIKELKRTHEFEEFFPSSAFLIVKDKNLDKQRQIFLSQFNQCIFTNITENQLFSMEIMEILDNVDYLKQEWKKKQVKNLIFKYILEQNHSIDYKNQLINVLCLQIYKNSTLSTKLKKLRFLLEKFGDHFLQMGDIQNMKKISLTFLVLSDNVNSRKMDENILKYLFQNSLNQFLAYILDIAFLLCTTIASHFTMDELIQKIQDIKIQINNPQIQLLKFTQCALSYLELEKKMKKSDSFKQCVQLRQLKNSKELEVKKLLEEKIVWESQLGDKINLQNDIRKYTPQIDLLRTCCDIKQNSIYFYYSVVEKVPILRLVESLLFKNSYDSAKLFEVIESYTDMEIPILKKVQLIILYILIHGDGQKQNQLLKFLCEIENGINEDQIEAIKLQNIEKSMIFQYLSSIQYALGGSKIVQKIQKICQKIVQKKIKTVDKAMTTNPTQQLIEFRNILTLLLNQYKIYQPLQKIDRSYQTYLNIRIKKSIKLMNPNIIPFSLQNSFQCYFAQIDIIKTYEQIFWIFQQLKKQNNHQIYHYLNFFSIKAIVICYNIRDQNQDIMQFFIDFCTHYKDTETKFMPNKLGVIFQDYFGSINVQLVKNTLCYLLQERKIKMSDMSRSFQYSYILYRLATFKHPECQYQYSVRKRLLNLIAFGTNCEWIPQSLKQKQIGYIVREYKQIYGLGTIRKKMLVMKKWGGYVKKRGWEKDVRRKMEKLKESRKRYGDIFRSLDRKLKKYGQVKVLMDCTFDQECHKCLQSIRLKNLNPYCGYHISQRFNQMISK